MTPVRWGSTQGRWIVAATVLGSGIVFLDGTVVNVALPAIQTDLGMSVAGLQWTIDAYLVTLTSLLLFGGSLGDIAGRRRVFVYGLIGFVVASVACGIAPNGGALIAARAAQGIAAAFLVPGSLAIVSSTFHPDDRSRAIGAWSGLAGATSALGPFVGGWLIDAVSWRLIFLINVPLVALTVWIAVKHVPETKEDGAGAPDLPGAASATVGLAALTYGLIEREPVATVIGLVLLAVFIAIERRAPEPILPLTLFRSSQFTGANLTTFAVYMALGGAFFLLVVQLQVGLGYSALEAGVAMMPVTVLMLILSARAGALAQRIGPRLPMTAGPLIAAAGLALFGRIEPGATYAADVLPAVVVFGIGLTLTVAPLTAAVLAAVDEHHVGAGSGVNNAVARLGGLIAVAVLPAVAGIHELTANGLRTGFATAMQLCAAICAAGGVIAFATVRLATEVDTHTHPSLLHACHHQDVAAA